MSLIFSNRSGRQPPPICRTGYARQGPKLLPHSAFPVIPLIYYYIYYTRLSGVCQPFYVKKRTEFKFFPESRPFVSFHPVFVVKRFEDAPVFLLPRLVSADVVDDLHPPVHPIEPYPRVSPMTPVPAADLALVEIVDVAVLDFDFMAVQGRDDVLIGQCEEEFPAGDIA